MFELTRKGDYALRLMIEVGRLDGGSLSTAEVARREEIPYQFLRKVARLLVAHGLLTAGRGVHGGVSLARPADAITVLDVIAAVEPPAVNRCTADPCTCGRRDSCAAFPLWLEVQQKIEYVLRSTRLSDLAAPRNVGTHARRAPPAGRPPRGTSTVRQSPT